MKREEIFIDFEQSMSEIKDFIQKVGDKHLLIHKSCRDEILLKLEEVQQNIISGEKELIENHFNSISNLKNLERKHKSLLISQKELN